jgi:predicted outer membrane repeat protein
VDAATASDTSNGFPSPVKTLSRALTLATATTPAKTIIVRDGTYSGTLNRDWNFNGKAVTIRSVNGPARTVIDLGNAGRAARIPASHPGGISITGIAFRNGSASADSTSDGTATNAEGGAFFINASTTSGILIHKAAFTNCWFIGCKASGTPTGTAEVDDGSGGAIRLRGYAAITVTGCQFLANSAVRHGGAIYAGSDSRFTATGCTFQYNEANGSGGAVYGNSALFFLDDNTLSWNIAGAIGYVSDDTIAGDGGAVYLNSASMAETLVSSGEAGPGAIWKYKTGSDLGSSAIVAGHTSYSSNNWKHPSFNDTAWASGSAEIGYGDVTDGRPERTTISSSPVYHVLYLRRQFTVADPTKYDGLRLRALIDDGAIFYINGVEVARDNMPAGTVGHAYSGLNAINEATYRAISDYRLAPNLLVAGTNTICVQVHQATATSTDLSFDLELKGTTGSRLSHCLVEGNAAFESGGGIFLNGTHENSTTITSCEIFANITADFIYLDPTHTAPSATRSGGGIAIDGFSPLIQASVIRWNESGTDGGGLSIRQSATILRACAILDNWTLLDGGGLIARTSAHPNIQRCTIVSNIANRGSGGGIRVNDANSALISLTGSIIWHNLAASATSPNFSPSQWLTSAPPSGTFNNVRIENTYLNAGLIENPPPVFLPDGYHLAENSPDRNIGLLSLLTDIDGESPPELPAGLPDLGCDEWVDSDEDGLSDFLEWGLISRNSTDRFTLLSDVNPFEDFDGDGVNNILDQNEGILDSTFNDGSSPLILAGRKPSAAKSRTGQTKVNTPQEVKTLANDLKLSLYLDDGSTSDADAWHVDFNKRAGTSGVSFDLEMPSPGWDKVGMPSIYIDPNSAPSWWLRIWHVSGDQDYDYTFSAGVSQQPKVGPHYAFINYTSTGKFAHDDDSADGLIGYFDTDVPPMPSQEYGRQEIENRDADLIPIAFMACKRGSISAPGAIIPYPDPKNPPADAKELVYEAITIENGDLDQQTAPLTPADASNPELQDARRNDAAVSAGGKLSGSALSLDNDFIKVFVRHSIPSSLRITATLHIGEAEVSSGSLLSANIRCYTKEGRRVEQSELILQNQTVPLTGPMHDLFTENQGLYFEIGDLGTTPASAGGPVTDDARAARKDFKSAELVLKAKIGLTQINPKIVIRRGGVWVYNRSSDSGFALFDGKGLIGGTDRKPKVHEGTQISSSFPVKSGGSNCSDETTPFRGPIPAGWYEINERSGLSLGRFRWDGEIHRRVDVQSDRPKFPDPITDKNADQGLDRSPKLYQGGYSLWDIAVPLRNGVRIYDPALDGPQRPVSISFKYDLTPNPDDRDAIQIHPDGHNDGTAGCVGLQNFQEAIKVHYLLRHLRGLGVHVRGAITNSWNE